MTWLGDDGSAFNGTPLEETRPRTHVLEERLEEVVEDQALVYQSVTGKQLDSSTALTDTSIPHVHDGSAGCLLGWPLSHGYRGNHDGNLGSMHRLRWPTIKAENITSIADRIVYRWPVFVPKGHSKFIVELTTTEAFYQLSPVLRVYNTSLVLQSEATQMFWGDTKFSYFAVDNPDDTDGNIWILSLDVTNAVEAQGMNHNIRNVRVLPEAWSGVESEALPVGEVAGHSGDITPSAATVFTPIHDMFTAANRPFSSYLARKLSHNDVICAELISGVPVPGNTSTLAHNHGGTVAKGVITDTPLFSAALGWVSLISANANGFDSRSATTEADNGAAPTIADPSITAYYDVMNTPVWIPDGVTSINWCAVLFDGTAEGTTTRIHTGATINATTNTATAQNTSTADWQYVSGTCTVTQNALNWIRLETQQRELKAGTPLVSCTGFACWAT